MAYEYEEFLIKQFNEAYRAGNLKQINLIKELKEVYAKARAFDEIKKSVIQIKSNYKDNEERTNKFIARETEYIIYREDK